MALNIVPSSDGRRQRSERSQTAIIEAALSLMDEGTLVPTAQQIADRAGVGIRSFFRHFADMDTLWAFADDMLISSYEALFEVEDRTGALSDRVARAIDLYGSAFDKLRPIILCTHAQLWRSPKLRENYGWHQKRLRKELRSQHCPGTDAKRCTRWLLSACGIGCVSFKGYRPKPVPRSSHRW